MDRFCDLPKTYSDRKLVIGWSGTGRNHVENLVMIGDALQRLDKEFDIKFKIIGAQNEKKIYRIFSGMKDASVLDWVVPERAPVEMAEIDIGLAPLMDTEFNKGKSGGKTLEYMSLGVVPVVSPIGIRRQIVRNGVDGFWAETPEEWYEKISRLICDLDLLPKFSQSGRRQVEENYAFEVIAKCWVDLLTSIVNAPSE